MSNQFASITIKQADSNAEEPAVDPRAEDAVVYGLNDTAVLAVDSEGKATRKGTLSVNLTQSREQTEIRTMERERDRYADMINAMHDERGNVKPGANYDKARVYRQKHDHIQSEIDLAMQIGAATGAKQMSQTPAHLAGSSQYDTGKIKSGIGTGQAPTLADIANDPDMPAHLREKAAAQLKRMKPTE